MGNGTVVNNNFSVYYKNTYWNDIPLVREYMCANFTGDKNVWWIDEFKRKYAHKPFKKALFINCGNGRIEREFIDKKIVKSAVAFDYSTDLIKQAKKLKRKRDIKYICADANTITFKKGSFDLIVNVAGLHHIQYINSFIHCLANSLSNNGIFVNFDYIGPHRNQYTSAQWRLVQRINNQLPSSKQHPMLLYPSVPVMLEEDPTEAIHSELILQTLNRYLTLWEQHNTGGGIAYLLLTHNPNLHKKNAVSHVKKILELDELYTRRGVVPQLFSYFIFRHNKQKIADKKIFERFQNIENRREYIARVWGGVYRYNDYISLIIFKLKKIVKQYVIPLLQRHRS